MFIGRLMALEKSFGGRGSGRTVALSSMASLWTKAPGETTTLTARAGPRTTGREETAGRFLPRRLASWGCTGAGQPQTEGQDPPGLPRVQHAC